jgi:hypothetical protein
LQVRILVLWLISFTYPAGAVETSIRMTEEIPLRTLIGRLATIASTVCIAVVAVVPGDSLPRNMPADAQRYADVLFRSQLQTEAAVAMLHRAGAGVVELRFRYIAGDVTWTGGLVRGTSMSPAAWAEQIRQAHNAGVVDMIANAERLASSPAGTLQLERKITSLRHAPAAFDAQPTIWGALVELSPAAEIRLRSEPSVESLKINEPKKRTLKNAKPSESHVSWDSWVPDEIWMQVQPSFFAGQRYVQMQTIWNAGRSLWFGDDFVGRQGTYEADMYLNGDGGTYITRAETAPATRIPDVYWTTDFPGAAPNAPYLDTRFGDDPPPDRWSYTIGVPLARLIATGTWYTTYIRGANGDANSDTAIAPPQLGYCDDPDGRGCSTWVVYSHETCPYPVPYQIGVPTNPDPWHWTRTQGGTGQARCP